MTDGRRAWSPLALCAGGLVWTAWSGLLAISGVATDGVAPAVALSALLLGAGLVGLVFELSWSYQFPGGEGAGVAALGGLAFGAGQALTALGRAGLALWLVAPGVLALVAGAVLLGVGLVRARAIRPWIGVAVLVASLAFLGFERAPVLAVPAGPAWLALGIHLWRHPVAPADGIEPAALRRRRDGR